MQACEILNLVANNGPMGQTIVVMKTMLQASRMADGGVLAEFGYDFVARVGSFSLLSEVRHYCPPTYDDFQLVRGTYRVRGSIARIVVLRISISPLKTCHPSPAVPGSFLAFDSRHLSDPATSSTQSV